MSEPTSEGVDRVLSCAPELFAYERWLADAREEGAAAARDYLFLDERVRFEPRREDVLVKPPGLTARERGGRVSLVSTAPAAEVPVGASPRREVERVLAAIDGERTLAEISWEVDADVLARVLRAAFGLLLFAPRSVADLEARISAIEIVRFPTSPYAVDRAYWENMAEVRARLLASAAALGGAPAFERLVRGLHVVALMGESLERFYRPASPATEVAVAPGALWRAVPRTAATARGCVFLDGPRVLAPLVGGARFFRRLAEGLGDAGAAHERESAWGTVVVARGERDAEARPWFLPRRPLDEDAVEALRSAAARGLSSAAEGRAEEACAHAAAFHWRYVRLHPFRCANQSVAMNVVGAILMRAGLLPVPHLALDHLALRLSEAAYAEVFARAVRVFGEPAETPAKRLGLVASRWKRALKLMDAVSAAPSDAAADAIVAADPEGARAALLSAG